MKCFAWRKIGRHQTMEKNFIVDEAEYAAGKMEMFSPTSEK